MLSKRILRHVSPIKKDVAPCEWPESGLPEGAFAVAYARNNVCFGIVEEGSVRWCQNPSDPFEVRVFDDTTERHYFKSGKVWSRRTIEDDKSDVELAFDEEFLVWGSRTGDENGFSILEEPGRGIRMVLPIDVDHATVVCRTYLSNKEPDNDTGKYVPIGWRLVKIQPAEVK